MPLVDYTTFFKRCTYKKNEGGKNYGQANCSRHCHPQLWVIEFERCEKPEGV